MSHTSWIYGLPCVSLRDAASFGPGSSCVGGEDPMQAAVPLLQSSSQTDVSGLLNIGWLY